MTDCHPAHPGATARFALPADVSVRAANLACVHEHICHGRGKSRQRARNGQTPPFGRVGCAVRCAAAIHFAVTFAHFSEYLLYGVFFLIISWAQAIWAAVVLWRPSKLWLRGSISWFAAPPQPRPATRDAPHEFPNGTLGHAFVLGACHPRWRTPADVRID